MAVALETVVRYMHGMKQFGRVLHQAADSHRARPKPRRSGFSMIELLVVIALILILTMMFWGGRGSGRQRQKQQFCQKNLQKISIALEIYSWDNNGRFPFVAGAKTSEEALDLLVPRYTVDTSSFICPGSSDPAPTGGEPLSRHRISYAYYMGRRSPGEAPWGWPASETVPEVSSRGGTAASDALMSDEQVNTLAKAAGQPAFSTTSKGPGSNHGKSGGNFLFGDGRVEHSPAMTPFSLVLTQGVVLLNPKP